MKTIKAANGQTVTEEMILKWGEALDNDEWPDGWRNVGEIVNGRAPTMASSVETLSVKVPAGMKRAIEREASAEGVSSSELVRSMLASCLLDKDSTAA